MVPKMVTMGTTNAAATSLDSKCSPDQVLAMVRVRSLNRQRWSGHRGGVVGACIGD